MNCGIMQPSYIPWRGAFHLIRKVDVYVFYDDVQYTKKSWRNRNRIKTPQGVRWLTIPVHARGSILSHTPIREVRIDAQQSWNVSHREKLHQCYRHAPFYRRHAGLLDRLYADPPELLADYTIATTIALARELRIEHTRFLRSSELNAPGRGTERVLSILRALGADRLLNGPSAREYTDEVLLEREGIALEYMTYDYPSYPQLHGDYDPALSILDLLLMVGDDAPRYIWG